MQILRLNKAGHPIDWICWQEAVCLYSRELVCWSLGETTFTVRGGTNQLSGRRSFVELSSIIACGGDKLARPLIKPRLSNRALFERDSFQCMYCGRFFERQLLTRDHIVPSSRSGRDVWENVVTACRRCNQHKGNHSLNDVNMELVALPYRPNPAEFLALENSRRILQEQAEFLQEKFSSNCRWQMPSSN